MRNVLTLFLFAFIVFKSEAQKKDTLYIISKENSDTIIKNHSISDNYIVGTSWLTNSPKMITLRGLGLSPQNIKSTCLQDNYEKGIRFMRMIGAIAPMVGLLGTVIGMIDSFEIISQSNEPVAPAQIAGGMKLAMFTTAYGLIIAIPCLFFAYLFTRMSERRISYFQKMLNRKSLEIDGATIA